MRVLAATLLLIVTLGGCGPVAPTASPTSTAAPSPLAFVVELPLATRTAEVAIVDTTGLVRGAKPASVAAASGSDAQVFLDRGILVRSLPGEQGLVLDWASGFCSRNQTITVSGSQSRLMIVVDLGTPSESVCDLGRAGLSVVLVTSVPVVANTVEVKLLR